MLSLQAWLQNIPKIALWGLKSNGIHRLLIYFRVNIIIYSFQAFFLPHCKKLQNHSSVSFLSFLSLYLIKLTFLENSWTVLRTFIIIRKSVFYLQYSNVESLFCNGFYYFFLTQPSGSCWRYSNTPRYALDFAQKT